jgi:hypothetical protein
MDFIKSLFGKKQYPIPALYSNFAKEYGTDMDFLLNQGMMYISSKMPERRFQSFVLFKSLGIPSPDTSRASEFNDEFFPLFLKVSVSTRLITESRQMDGLYGENVLAEAVAQSYIENSAPRRAYIRTVVDAYKEKEKSIMGSVVFYSLDEDRWNYPPKEWGVIPLTGKLKKLNALEQEILVSMNIDSGNPMIPDEILDPIFNNYDADGNSFFSYLRFYQMLGLDAPGIDNVYGLPFTFSEGFAPGDQRWEFLEVQHGARNDLLKEAGAWIGKK